MKEYNINGLSIFKFTLGPLAVNTYLVVLAEGKTIIIDPGAEGYELVKFIKGNKLIPTLLLNTHGHPDHTGNNWIIKENFPEIKIGIHPEDILFLNIDKIDIFNFKELLNIKYMPQPDLMLSEGNPIRIEDKIVKILHTPGHSPGSISLLIDKILFSGDTIFKESIGRTDLPGGSYREIEKSIREKIYSLPDDILILPGHGEDTSVIHEKYNNFFVKYD